MAHRCRVADNTKATPDDELLRLVLGDLAQEDSYTCRSGSGGLMRAWNLEQVELPGSLDLPRV
jgi:hypothetical protein